MQPNQISLSVDTLNDGAAIETQNYDRFEEFLNRSKYVGENHTLAMRDELTLYRTFPKQAGNLRGVQKSAVKFTFDVLVPGVDGTTMLVQPLIIEVSAAIPVGVTDVITRLCRQRAVSLLDLDSVMDPLNNKLMV